DKQHEEDDVLRRLGAGDSIKDFETLRVHKNGSLIPIALTGSPIRNAEGVVVGASTIARDISERKRREAQLAASEAARDDLQRRLLALVGASTQLIATARLPAVVASALSIAHDLVAADGYAIWRLQPGIEWRPVAFDGISAEFASVVTAQGTNELQ